MIPWFYLPRYEENEAYNGKVMYLLMCVRAWRTCLWDVLNVNVNVF
jgi:hypothetical protein